MIIKKRKKSNAAKSKAAKSKAAERKRKSRSKKSDKAKQEELVRNKERNRNTRKRHTQEERQEQQDRNKERQRNARKRQTQEERIEENEEAKKRKAAHRAMNKSTAMNKLTTDNITNNVEDKRLLHVETIDKAKAKALKILHQTHIPTTNLHQANVCVVCDCFIIGTEPVKRLSLVQLKHHQIRLGVTNYEKFYKRKTLSSELRGFYKVKGLPDMLLSPRANKNEKGYSCCRTCHNGMRQSKRDQKPPKLSIANGFVIGEFPKLKYRDDNDIDCEFDVESDLTEVMRALLAPTRSHGYIMAFTGGKHKSIMGHYQCFEVDQTKLGGAMSYIQHQEKHKYVYCMLSGRMTKKQKQIVTKECTVDTNLYSALMSWFIDKSGHGGYANTLHPKECPQPHIIRDKDTKNNTDDSLSPDVEESFSGGSYHFSTAQDPNVNNSVYENGNDFTVAMLNEATPTLLVSGGKYANMKEIDLESLLPFAFPFGVGTPKQNRPVRLSYPVCLQRYMRLAMRQFMRGDVILIMNHIYGRQQSYRSGVMTSRSNIRGESLGEHFSKIPVEELQAASDENDPKISTMVSKLMRSISTSCRALGYTPEAAQFARRCGFAMQDYYGLNSVFLTITPDDQCNYRIKLFTRPGEEVSNYIFWKLFLQSKKKTKQYLTSKFCLSYCRYHYLI